MKKVFIADRDQSGLAQQLAKATENDLLEVETVHFADTEIKPILNDKDNRLLDAHAIIVHSTSRPVNDNFMWILFVCDILRAKGVKKISVIIPYFGYSRQDIYDDGSEGPGYVVMRMLEAAGISELIAIELHAAVLQKAVSSMQVHNIQLHKFIAEFVSKEYEHKDVTIVAPDKGSAQRASYIAGYLDVPLVRATKERCGADKTRLLSLDNSCKTNSALIVDDIIDTGSTMLHVIQKIRASNDRCKIDLFAIHSVLSNNAAQLLQESCVNRVWVTDSVELQDQQMFQKLHVVDISSVLVKVLRDLF